MKKIIIVGGVAGGMSAATRLRRLMEDAEIIVFEKGPYVSFANCGLPYYVSGEISDRAALLVQTPEQLKARFNIEARVNQEVIAIDSDKKTVQVKTHEMTYWESYDELILSPGAKPFVPAIEGLDQASNVFSLRNIPDLDKIMTQLQSQTIAQVLMVGGGFIGIEMAENLKKRGLKVALIEKSSHLLPTLDAEMACFIEEEMRKQGIELYLGQSVIGFQEEGNKVILDNGESLVSDLTLMSVGIQPDTKLAEESGITLGVRGAILVDEAYKTNIDHIYAVGDAIQVHNPLNQEDMMISLASPANRQGRQVADNIAGIRRPHRGSIGTSIVRAFGMTAASTGLTEFMAQRAGLHFGVVHISGKDHAGYYPGSTMIFMKLVFDRERGQILGAQAVGTKGVDKRIDVMSTAIKAGLTVADLPELELTYAPPFGSAKDPVNMIGYAALNLLEGISDNIQWHQLVDEISNGKQLLDVRNPQELVSNGQIRGAINIPLDQLRGRLGELDKAQKYIVTCHSGQRSYIAERILKQNGFNVQNLDGAFTIYSRIKAEEIVHD